MGAVIGKYLFGTALWRGIVAIIVFVVFWEFGARSKDWITGEAFAPLRALLQAGGFKTTHLPWIGVLPTPSSVAKVWVGLLSDPGYWESWYLSFMHVMSGFIAALVVGIPYGLMLAVSRTAYGVGFPVFEILRPIPPLAWVPASIIFWPTQEMSIAFVTFLGAVFTIVINVVGGARSIDVRYFQAAQSMGSSGWDIFKRIILPGTLPSITVGAAVGMGITWEVVVAAEMISGGGTRTGSAQGGGLGFLIWNAYIGASYEHIVIGMISIGIAGYMSSELLRYLGKQVTPWLRLR